MEIHRERKVFKVSFRNIAEALMPFASANMTKHPAINKQNFNSFFFTICLWSSMCGTINGLHNLDIPAETHKIDNVTY